MFYAVMASEHVLALQLTSRVKKKISIQILYAASYKNSVAAASSWFYV